MSLESGKLYTFGFNRDGQLGKGDLLDSNVPVLLPPQLFNGEVTMAEGGKYHSVVLTSKVSFKLKIRDW
jgi:hypothetical protein